MLRVSLVSLLLCGCSQPDGPRAAGDAEPAPPAPSEPGAERKNAPPDVVASKPEPKPVEPKPVEPPLPRMSACFREGVGLSLPSAPIHADAGDLDGDKRTDVVVLHDGALTVLLAEEGGTFRREETKPVASQSIEVGLGDFDEDGHLDAVLAEDTLRTVRFYKGDGHGHFAEGRTSEGGGDNTRGAAVADFNGDGHLDLAVAVYANVIRTLHGDGRGRFARKAAISAGDADLVRPIARDIDGNGLPDIVVPNRLDGARGPYIASNLGKGEFGPGPAPFCDSRSDRAALGDFDGNGSIDVAVSGISSARACVGLRDGAGFRVETIEGGGKRVVGASIAALVAGDVVEGGTDELIVADERGIRVLSLGASEFAIVGNVTAAAPRYVWVDDVDVDGSNDLLWLGRDRLEVGLQEPCRAE